MRRSSHRTTHRSNNSDLLDELENESRHTAQQPIPPIRLGSPVRRAQDVEDRRNWAPRSPSPKPAPRDFSGRNARISHQPKKSPRVIRGPGGKPLQSKFSVTKALEHASPRFAEARKTIICFKRKVRREVLHALKRTKSGAGQPKRRNEWSDVQC